MSDCALLDCRLVSFRASSAHATGHIFPNFSGGSWIDTYHETTHNTQQGTTIEYDSAMRKHDY